MKIRFFFLTKFELNLKLEIMKNIILLIALIISSFAKAQTINFADVNFKTKLINRGVDANNDGNIQISEAIAITDLDVSLSNISNLSGIENFTNLLTLNCSQNNISSINFSSLTNLVDINCYSNPISTLDFTGLNNFKTINCGGSSSLTSVIVAGLTGLENLYCIESSLTSINLSGLNNLKSLGLNSCQISNLNLSNLTNLEELGCSNNLLNTLSISNLINLKRLFCESNNLSNLELNGLTNLSSLFVSNNPITSLNLNSLNNLAFMDCFSTLIYNLDFSNCPMFDTLNCWSNPNLVSINLKNGIKQNYAYVSIGDNPNLRYICADDNEISVLDGLISGQNTSIIINSYCSFLPGGNYNTISGTVKLDSNNNGCDSNDFNLDKFKVNINDGTVNYSTYTNSSGIYNFYVGSGNYVISPQSENANYFNLSPTSATINFATANQTLQTQDFCVSTNGVHNDLEVSIIPIGVARPGFDANYQIIYKNKGNQTISGEVALTFDDDSIDLISSNPQISGQFTNILNWNYANLLPFETRTIDLKFNLNSPLENPALNSGSILEFNAVIFPFINDDSPNDNNVVWEQPVVNSFDPNDITCLEGDVVEPSKIGDYLHYKINFENKGTADAVNIVVKDIIDSTKFDINSLAVLNTSHQVRTNIKNNVVEFIFKNIYLPPSSLGFNGNGYILFKIKTLSTLNIGETVKNKANIYFDYNAPIETNEANTTFAVLSNLGFVLDNSISVYPNPSASKININCNTAIKSVEVYDIQGRILETIIDNKNIIDISEKSNGVYFLKINTDKGSKVENIVKY